MFFNHRYHAPNYSRLYIQGFKYEHIICDCFISIPYHLSYLENLAFNLKQTAPAITTIATTETVIGITIIMISKNIIRETIQNT